MMTVTLKDVALYRGALMARAKALLAEARGTRWDRVAGRVAGLLGFVAGLSAYAGFVPGKAGAMVAGVCAVCAMLAPRALRAAGLMATAYDQQRPLLPVLWEVMQVFANPKAIVAQAKSAALDAEAAQEADQAQQQAAEVQQAASQAQAQQSALIKAAVAEAVSTLSGTFLPGPLKDNLSTSVPDALKQPPTPPAPLVEAMPFATVPAEDQNVAASETGDTL